MMSRLASASALVLVALPQNETRLVGRQSALRFCRQAPIERSEKTEPDRAEAAAREHQRERTPDAEPRIEEHRPLEVTLECEDFCDPLREPLLAALEVVLEPLLLPTDKVVVVDVLVEVLRPAHRPERSFAEAIVNVSRVVNAGRACYRMAVPRVAVSISIYNDERYLPVALGALSRQTYRDFHVTVYDDGSTDASVALAEKWQDRLPLMIVRAAHLGLPHAKHAAARAVPQGPPYLLALDSDIELAPDALERMVGELNRDDRLGAVSCHARSPIDRRFGAAQAFMDDLYRWSNADEEGNTNRVVGACVLFRRVARDPIELTGAVHEDSELAYKLRASWRLKMPRDLVAIHDGVPTTLDGLFRRGVREGARVRALSASIRTRGRWEIWRALPRHHWWRWAASGCSPCSRG